MTIEYEGISDYEIPTLRLSKQNDYEIGFFGRKYKYFLKEKHRIIYYNLLTQQQLFPHIKLVEDEANELYESLINAFKDQEKVDEKLKADDPIRWVQNGEQYQKSR